MRVGIGLLRIAVGIVVVATAWACELEGDPPTQVPLDQADEALRKAYCERMFDCRCDQGRQFEEIAECREWVDGRVQRVRDEAERTGLTYDPACLGATLDRLDALGCAAAVEDEDDESCVNACHSLHGDVPVGEVCEASGETVHSNCAQGLECNIEECDDSGVCTGRCENPCLGACPTDCGDDARCVDGMCTPLPGIGQDCSDYGCASGLVCIYEEEDATCGRLPELGEDCTNTSQCAEDLRCEFDSTTGEGTCVGPTALGEACTGHAECDSGYCPAGFCDELPGEGESCEGTFACSEGLDCDFDTHECVTGDAIVCQLFIEID